MFSFYLGNCSACGRLGALQGRKRKRCYDCKNCGYTYRTKNIPWRVVEQDDEKPEANDGIKWAIIPKSFLR